MRKLFVSLSILLALSLALAACSQINQQANTPGAVNPSGTQASGFPSINTPAYPLNETPVVSATAPVTSATTPVPTEATNLSTTPAVTTTVPSVTQTMPITGTTGITSTSGLTSTTGVTGTTGMSETMPLPATGMNGPIMASTLLSQTVTTSDNQAVGQVAALAVNLSDTHVDYLFVQKTGSVGRSGNVAIPWQAFKLNNQNLSISVDQAAVQAAPVSDLTSVPTLGSAAWESAYDTYWGSKVPEAAPSAATGTITNTQTITTGMTGVLLWSSKLEQTINAPNGQEIGKVSDLVINGQTGNAQFVILATGPDLGNKTIPVPIQMLTLDKAKNLLNLNVDVNQLAQAPTIDLNTLTPAQLQSLESTIKSFWNQFMNTSP